MMIFRSSQMTTTPAIAAVVLLLGSGLSMTVSAADTAAASEDSPVLVYGTGKNLCSNFIEVVDGNWSHPLNALHFHGYLSWAQGYLTLHNQSHSDQPVHMDADTLKTQLIEECRETSDQTFANAVQNLID